MVVLQSLDWDTCDVTSNDFMQPLLRHLPLSLPPSQHHQVIRHAQTFACLAATGGCVWLRVVVCPWLCVLVCLWLCVVVFLGLCVVVYVVFGVVLCGCVCGYGWFLFVVLFWVAVCNGENHQNNTKKNNTQQQPIILTPTSTHNHNTISQHNTTPKQKPQHNPTTITTQSHNTT